MTFSTLSPVYVTENSRDRFQKAIEFPTDYEFMIVIISHNYNITVIVSYNCNIIIL